MQINDAVCIWQHPPTFHLSYHQAIHKLKILIVYIVGHWHIITHQRTKKSLNINVPGKTRLILSPLPIVHSHQLIWLELQVTALKYVFKVFRIFSHLVFQVHRCHPSSCHCLHKWSPLQHKKSPCKWSSSAHHCWRLNSSGTLCRYLSWKLITCMSSADLTLDIATHFKTETSQTTVKNRCWKRLSLWFMARYRLRWNTKILCHRNNNRAIPVHSWPCVLWKFNNSIHWKIDVSTCVLKSL